MYNVHTLPPPGTLPVHFYPGAQPVQPPTANVWPVRPFFINHESTDQMEDETVLGESVDIPVDPSMYNGMARYRPGQPLWAISNGAAQYPLNPATILALANADIADYVAGKSANTSILEITRSDPTFAALLDPHVVMSKYRFLGVALTTADHEQHFKGDGYFKSGRVVDFSLVMRGACEIQNFWAHKAVQHAKVGLKLELTFVRESPCVFNAIGGVHRSLSADFPVFQWRPITTLQGKEFSFDDSTFYYQGSTVAKPAYVIDFGSVHITPADRGSVDQGIAALCDSTVSPPTVRVRLAPTAY